MPNTLDWVEIRTHTPQDLAQFYGDVFGWTVLEEKTVGGSQVLILDTGGTPRSENLRRFGIWHRSEESQQGVIVYVVVADIEATLRRITESGGKVVTPVTEFGFGIVADFTDPSGNRFALVQDRPGKIPDL